MASLSLLMSILQGQGRAQDDSSTSAVLLQHMGTADWGLSAMSHPLCRLGSPEPGLLEAAGFAVWPLPLSLPTSNVPPAHGDGHSLTSANELLPNAWAMPALLVGLVTQTGHHHRTPAETGGADSLQLPSRGGRGRGTLPGASDGPSSIPHPPPALSPHEPQSIMVAELRGFSLSCSFPWPHGDVPSLAPISAWG